MNNPITLASLAFAFALAAAPARAAESSFEVTKTEACQLSVWSQASWKAADSQAFRLGEKAKGSVAAKGRYVYLSKGGKKYSILKSCTRGGEDGEGVDLMAMDAPTKPVKSSQGAQSQSMTNSDGHEEAPGANPHFRIYFDFALYSRPGVSDFTFDSFHNLVMLELQPIEDLQFNFDLNPNPRYFELDYNINSRLQVRVGKIWIPFDDMYPHNIFGGRVNVARLSPSGTTFLPDLWTDLGVGFKYQLVDTGFLSAVAHAYIVNGFRGGGTDPKGGGGDYPSFGDLPTSPDNNRDKALGARFHALILRKFGMGASIYSGQWSPTSSARTGRVTIFGTDGQFRLSSTELRGGFAFMNVSMPTADSFTRAGMYAEIGQRFGGRSQYKALLRGGQLQLDNRVNNKNDQKIIGTTVLYDINSMLQVSLEHSRDVEQRGDKDNYTFTATRLVMAF